MVVSPVTGTALTSLTPAVGDFPPRYPFIKNDQFSFLFENVLTAYLADTYPHDFQRFAQLRSELSKLWTDMQTLKDRAGGWEGVQQPEHAAEFAQLNKWAEDFHKKGAEYGSLKNYLESDSLDFVRALTQGKHKDLLAGDVARFFKNSTALKQTYKGKEKLYQSYLTYYSSDLDSNKLIVDAAEFAKYIKDNGLFPAFGLADWADKPNPFLSGHLLK